MEVADRMEQWFEEGGCDGFVVAATYVPGAYEDFVKFVVPELQRRGLFRREYEGRTLRDHLGLARPERGDWRRPAGGCPGPVGHPRLVRTVRTRPRTPQIRKSVGEGI